MRYLQGFNVTTPPQPKQMGLFESFDVSAIQVPDTEIITDLHGHEELFPPAPEKPTYVSAAQRSRSTAVDNFSRIRLSKNFIMRDFLYSARGDVLNLTNYPQDSLDQVVRSGKQLCEQILEPVLAQFGRFAITFGYQNRSLIEAGYKKCAPQSSAPHQWDRGTFGNKVYARVDIWPFCVEDGEVDRHEFARWTMYNLDIDLVMQWRGSNVYCLTISPKPGRVWVEWVGEDSAHSKSVYHMGQDFWLNQYPTMPKEKRPKFGPSCSGGSLKWS